MRTTEDILFFPPSHSEASRDEGVQATFKVSALFNFIDLIISMSLKHFTLGCSSEFNKRLLNFYIKIQAEIIVLLLLKQLNFFLPAIQLRSLSL